MVKRLEIERSIECGNKLVDEVMLIYRQTNKLPGRFSICPCSMNYAMFEIYRSILQQDFNGYVSVVLKTGDQKIRIVVNKQRLM